MHLHGNCFSLRVIFSEFYWRNKCKCAINTFLEGWIALTDSLTHWVAASRLPVCCLLHQSSISERAIKNKGRSYKPDFLWNLRLKKNKTKQKKTEQQLPVNQGEIPPAPTAITAARKWLLSSVNSEDRGLGLWLESCGYCGGEVWGGDGAAVSGSFALARSGEVDVQLFVRWPKV